MSTINRCSLKLDIEDTWSWMGSKNEIYSTINAYKVIRGNLLETGASISRSTFKKIWTKFAPHKVSATT